MRNNQLALSIAKRRWLRRLGIFDLPDQAETKIFGKPFFVDLSDWRGPSYHLMNWGVETYERDNLGMIAKIFPENGVFFDIGANVGIYSFCIANLGKAQKIYAFEPEPRAYGCLARTIERNQLGEQIELSKIGLSDYTGESHFFVSEENAGGHSLNDRAITDENLKVAEQITVAVTTLDEFCRRKNVGRIDLMKIDVQRHESQVLTGGQETLARFQPIISMECYHPELERMVQQLTLLDYHIIFPAEQIEVFSAKDLNKYFAQYKAEYLDLVFAPADKVEEIINRAERPRA